MSHIKAFLVTCTIFAVGFIILALLAFYHQPEPAKNITWGINFSQTQTETLKLDWRSAYLAMLEDLGAKNIKLLVDWDKIETTPGNYSFDDIDWQLQQAKSHGASVLYVLGMKSGRWPECHIPDWASSMSLNKEQQQEKILAYIQETVQRYKADLTIIAWQVENEPLVNFGECPWTDIEFLKKEVALVKSLDPLRPIFISDSGEQSRWLDAASIGDAVGVTLYRKIATGETLETASYSTYDIQPVSYWRKAKVVEFLYGKKVICAELQAEPWFINNDVTAPLKDQEKTFNLQQFEDNIAYAKQTGLDRFYLWGAEWWYWMKVNQNKPAIWNYAGQLLKYGKM